MSYGCNLPHLFLNPLPHLRTPSLQLTLAFLSCITPRSRLHLLCSPLKCTPPAATNTPVERTIRPVTTVYGHATDETQYTLYSPHALHAVYALCTKAILPFSLHLTRRKPHNKAASAGKRSTVTSFRVDTAWSKAIQA